MASSSSLAGKGKRHAVPEDSSAFCLRIFSREDLNDGKKFNLTSFELFAASLVLALLFKFTTVQFVLKSKCSIVLSLRLDLAMLLKMLELPPAAAREYGHQMADHISLKVPNCGKHWKIELRTSPRRYRMWLEKGREEFASFYLLDQGDMATFSSEGENSHFQLMSAHQREEIGAEAVAIAISVSPRSSADDRGRAKVRRRRRRVTGSEAEARAISISPRSSADEHEYDVSSFRSDEPFLDIRIPAKTSAFHVFINQAFASEHFYKADICCDLTLQNIQGAGWKAFRQDNHLEEGDVCVLEVIEELKRKTEISAPIFDIQPCTSRLNIFKRMIKHLDDQLMMPKIICKLHLASCSMGSSPNRDRKGKRPAIPEDSPFFCFRIVNLDDIKDGNKVVN
uniref:Transcription factor b3 n=1 Tax=Rosa rugosa TaxID=74645 RepID=J7G2Y4_ROSRU|nr:transcription factor b3 [Rosa rugosa]